MLSFHLLFITSIIGWWWSRYRSTTTIVRTKTIIKVWPVHVQKWKLMQEKNNNVIQYSSRLWWCQSRSSSFDLFHWDIFLSFFFYSIFSMTFFSLFCMSLLVVWIKNCPRWVAQKRGRREGKEKNASSSRFSSSFPKDRIDRKKKNYSSSKRINLPWKFCEDNISNNFFSIFGFNSLSYWRSGNNFNTSGFWSTI